jgi:phage replication-related protein YjqB (UPF0714/DUF867 family)
MSQEQKLVDLCFEIALTISANGSDRKGQPLLLCSLSDEKKAEWIAKQLRSAGFDTKPCGASWGILTGESK